jgi:hypothetical protein
MQTGAVETNKIISLNNNIEFETLEDVIAPGWAYVAGFVAGVAVVGGSVLVGVAIAT